MEGNEPISPETAPGGGMKFLVAVIAGVLLLGAGYLWMTMKQGPKALDTAQEYFTKGIDLYNQGNFTGAKENFIKGLELNDAEPFAYAFLGSIENPDTVGKKDGYEGSYARSIAFYEKSFATGLSEKNKAYRTAMKDLGFMYEKNGQNDKADEQFLKFIAVFPDDAYWARYSVAKDYFDRLYKEEEARDILAPDAATSTTFNDPYLVDVLLGRIYFYLDDFVNTEKFAKSALDRRSPAEDVIPYVLLANAAAKKGDKKMLDEAVRGARTKFITPTDECFIARASVTGKDYATAIAIAKKLEPVANTYPGSVCLRTLAMSYLATGKKTDAKAYLEKYITLAGVLDPKTPFTVRDLERSKMELVGLK